MSTTQKFVHKKKITVDIIPPNCIENGEKYFLIIAPIIGTMVNPVHVKMNIMLLPMIKSLITREEIGTSKESFLCLKK